ncbi:MAG: hypothetical protein ACRDVG_00195 [Jatrophihabitantaceae bacterium]
MNVDLVDPKNADASADGPDVDPGLDVQSERAGRDRSDEMIDEWGRQSFPASDPPSNW